MKYGNSLTHSHMHTRTYAYIHTYTRKHTQASPKRSVKFHTYAMASWRCVSVCLSLPLCPCLTFCLFFSLSAHKHWHLAQTDNARVWVRVCMSAHKSRQCFLPRNFSQVLRCLCSLALALLLPPHASLFLTLLSGIPLASFIVVILMMPMSLVCRAKYLRRHFIYLCPEK